MVKTGLDLATKDEISQPDTTRNQHPAVSRKPHNVSLFPPIQGLCEVYPDRIEPEDVRAATRDGSLKTEWYSSLRAELRMSYFVDRQGTIGRDIKNHWTSDIYMDKVVDPMPVLRFHRRNLEPLCNKPTMLYWELSAQKPDQPYCSGFIFACIYKFWFRFHDNAPDIDFGRFFAHPIRITPTGPQTIPEILKLHAHLCDAAASHLKTVKSSNAGTCSIERSRWQRFHLLPLCRAIIVLFDELSAPVFESNNTILLDDEVRRQSAVLVLTGHDQDLSSAIDFHTIRAESLPLARRDVSGIDGENTIRVSLKTAVQFIAELQQREKRAFMSSQRGSAETTPETEIYGVSTTAVNDADEYAEKILANPTESSSWSEIQYAYEGVKAKQKGDIRMAANFCHWSPRWI